MVPAFVVLTIYQGQTYNDSVELLDDAGEPVDLTGRSARMQVREYRGGPLVMELGTADGTIEMAAGVIQFNIPADVTAAIPIAYDYGMWVYSLELVTPGTPDVVETPIFGAVVFYPEITV